MLAKTRARFEALETEIADLRAELKEATQHEHPHDHEDVLTVLAELGEEVVALKAQVGTLVTALERHEHPHFHPQADLPPVPKEKVEYEDQTFINDVPVKVFPRMRKKKAAASE